MSGGVFDLLWAFLDEGWLELGNVNLGKKFFKLNGFFGVCGGNGATNLFKSIGLL